MSQAQRRSSLEAGHQSGHQEPAVRWEQVGPLAGAMVFWARQCGQRFMGCGLGGHGSFRWAL